MTTMIHIDGLPDDAQIAIRGTIYTVRELAEMVEKMDRHTTVESPYLHITPVPTTPFEQWIADTLDDVRHEIERLRT